VKRSKSHTDVFIKLKKGEKGNGNDTLNIKETRVLVLLLIPILGRLGYF